MTRMIPPFTQFRVEFKNLKHHDQLFSMPAAAAAKRTELKPRWKTRAFKVLLPANLAKLYVEDVGNLVFNGTVMDELDNDSSQPMLPSSASTNVADPQVASSPRSLSSIVKDAVIPKFGGSKLTASNASAWLEIFESECRRLNIEEARFWGTIRLFLQDAAEKCYDTTRLSNLSTLWSFWKENFLKNFGQHGIASARYVFLYRFINVSLSDYIWTKLNLLVSFNPKMHELDKTAHLILGLSNHLQERVSLVDNPSLGKLISSICVLDRPVTRATTPTLFTFNSSSLAFSSLRPKTPCPYCKKKVSTIVFM